MPRFDRLTTRGGQTTSHRHQTSDHDVEANRRTPLATPQTPTFPGATYGFEPSDQPAVPPRRVSSIHSFKNNNRSVTSLHTSPHAPPPLPASYATSADPSYYHQDASHPAQAGSAQQGGTYGEDGDNMAEELSWGPAHPCFPHPNPHVPIASPEYQSTRIIRIRRDWMIAGDLAPTYSNVYPEILDPLLPETQFRYIIEHVNATLLQAYDPFATWNWIDGLLGLATGWFWEDFRHGGVKTKLQELEKWMEEWNERVGWKDGVRLIPLRRTGYMDLDIEIPDPQVRVVNEDEDGQDQELGAEGESEVTGEYARGYEQQQQQQQPQHQRAHVPVPGPSQAGDFGHITTQPSSTARR